MPARDLAKAAKVKEAIQRESPKAELIIMEIDLSSLTSVNRFCSQFLALRLPLNILMWVSSFFYQRVFSFFFFVCSIYIVSLSFLDRPINIVFFYIFLTCCSWYWSQFCRNNGGIFSQALEYSEDKIEMTFATNYLGIFHTTYLYLTHVHIKIFKWFGKYIILGFS